MADHGQLLGVTRFIDMYLQLTTIARCGGVTRFNVSEQSPLTHTTLLSAHHTPHRQMQSVWPPRHWHDNCTSVRSGTYARHLEIGLSKGYFPRLFKALATSRGFRTFKYFFPCVAAKTMLGDGAISGAFALS